MDLIIKQCTFLTLLNLLKRFYLKLNIKLIRIQSKMLKKTYGWKLKDEKVIMMKNERKMLHNK